MCGRGVLGVLGLLVLALLGTTGRHDAGTEPEAAQIVWQSYVKSTCMCTYVFVFVCTALTQYDT